MTQTITLFGRTFTLAPTLLQQRCAGRLACVVAAASIMALAFAPILLQAAQM